MPRSDAQEAVTNQICDHSSSSILGDFEESKKSRDETAVLAEKSCDETAVLSDEADDTERLASPREHTQEGTVVSHEEGDQFDSNPFGSDEIAQALLSPRIVKSSWESRDRIRPDHLDVDRSSATLPHSPQSIRARSSRTCDDEQCKLETNLIELIAVASSPKSRTGISETMSPLISVGSPRNDLIASALISDWPEFGSDADPNDVQIARGRTKTATDGMHRIPELKIPKAPATASSVRAQQHSTPRASDGRELGRTVSTHNRRIRASPSSEGCVHSDSCGSLTITPRSVCLQRRVPMYPLLTPRPTSGPRATYCSGQF
jgi:hypothetical protein